MQPVHSILAYQEFGNTHILHFLGKKQKKKNQSRRKLFYMTDGCQGHAVTRGSASSDLVLHMVPGFSEAWSPCREAECIHLWPLRSSKWIHNWLKVTSVLIKLIKGENQSHLYMGLSEVMEGLCRPQKAAQIHVKVASGFLRKTEVTFT